MTELIYLTPGKYFFDFTNNSQAENLRNFLNLQTWSRETQNPIIETQDTGRQMSAVVEVQSDTRLPQYIVEASPPTLLEPGQKMSDFTEPEGLSEDWKESVEKGLDKELGSLTKTLKIIAFYGVAGAAVFLLWRNRK